MPDPVELRVLEGPNLYFPRPAVKLVLDVTALLALPAPDAGHLARAVGAASPRPGEPASALRERWAVRLLEALVRRVAASSGTTRLAVRVRPGPEPGLVVVAYPWRHRRRAEAFGEAVAAALDGSLTGEVEEALRAAAATIRAVGGAAEPPPTLQPTIPVVSVTGTNGKTTTTRLIAHMGRCAGLRVGWSNTDGIYVDGRVVEEGDWSGPGGARRVLAEEGLGLAVLETARGGILLRGVGVTANDVAVVTNIAADHLGMQGVHTLDELAEVKATIVRITRPTGWAVLNADDPRVLGMRTATRARTWAFSLDPASPGLRAVLTEGGRGITVIAGTVTTLPTPADTEELLAVTDIPVTLAGLSPHNTANALAAAAAGLAIGLPQSAVVEGLRTFDAALNPGRMNLYDVAGATVVVDLAHNVDGLEALLLVGLGLRAPGARLTTVLGAAGDRRDEDLREIAVLGARRSDAVVVALKTRYLRGRDPLAMVEIFRAGAAESGVTDVPAYPDEVSAVEALLAGLRYGDVLAVMCHAQREEIVAALEASGAAPLDAAGVRARVMAAAG